jgi:hypothetical protein
MNDTSPVGTSNQSAKRKPVVPAFVLLLLSFWLLAVSAQRTEAQSITQQVQMDLLRSQASVRQFYQTQAEMEQYRDRERLQVPGYSSDLSNVVGEFQKHIADMHFRHVTCKICKSHVKRMLQLAKRIEGAMK